MYGGQICCIEAYRRDCGSDQVGVDRLGDIFNLQNERMTGTA